MSRRHCVAWRNQFGVDRYCAIHYSPYDFSSLALLGLSSGGPSDSPRKAMEGRCPMARPHNRDIVIPQQRDGSPAVYPLGSHSAPVRREPASVRTTDAAFGASTGPGSVVSTLELSRRPTRPPDHESENRALVALVEAMTAASSDRILQTLVETARDLWA